MTQLSRLAVLGMAKETVIGTYVAPTVYIPFTGADYEDMYAQLKDESYRANDSVLQGMYQGGVEADWSIDLLAYADVVGHFLRAVIGPDTVVAAASTTLSGSTSIGATSITVASATGITGTPNATYIQIGSGATGEVALVTGVTGTTLTVTTVAGSAVGLTKVHSSADPVVSQTVHTFKQSTTAAKATYSLTVYDTSSGTPTLGYADTVFSDVQIKIDPKSSVTLTTKAKALPGVSQSTPTPTYTALAPVLGWEWSMTNAGATSTRGLSLDLSIKRQVEVIHSSNGVQSPREIFQGALEVDGTYKAIFENLTDMNLYTAYTQLPMTALLQQPVAFGGASLALTLSQSGWFKGKRDLTSPYVQADFSLAGIYNTTDAGSVSATLKNFITTAY
jgi:Phage tail tube protein